MATGRFGVSLLSKKNISEAYKEELMADKETGEILIKTEDGDTVSYSYSTRLKQWLDTSATLIDNSGSEQIAVYVVNTDNTLPTKIDFEQNLAEDSVLTVNRFSKFLLRLDVDCLVQDSNGISIKHIDPTITYDMTITLSDGTELPFAGSIPLGTFNTMVFGLSGKTSEKITFNELSIGSDITTTDARIILNSIVLATDVVE